jgi:hypothetical protein
VERKDFSKLEETGVKNQESRQKENREEKIDTRQEFEIEIKKR